MSTTAVSVPRDRWREWLFKNRFAADRGKFAISCGDGWKSLICDLVDALDGLGVAYKIRQIKEKFGALCFYTDINGTSHANRDRFQLLIDEAETKSVSTCEACGDPANGPALIDDHLFASLCDGCRVSRNLARLFKEKE